MGKEWTMKYPSLEEVKKLHALDQIFEITKHWNKEMKTAFDYKDQPSIWLTDTKMKRFKQGEEYAKKKQDSRDINDKNQVFIYSKALFRKKWFNKFVHSLADKEDRKEADIPMLSQE